MRRFAFPRRTADLDAMDDAAPVAPSPDPPPDEAAGWALDDARRALEADFEILRTLGRGSVASVYLARDRALGVLVAIKVLRPGKADDETVCRRFEREARAAASLSDHPNIVSVTRFGRFPDETPYLVMQYVKGRTMEERLEAEARLPTDEARQVLREVASALALAHDKGIVHRDLRPRNVLWDEEKGRALLTDFGIAAVLSQMGWGATRLTKTGQLLGDPRYLSPEQLGDGEFTEQADMYLFGILGYELLAGASPYEARSLPEWITAHLRGKPRPLRELRPDAPAALAGLLMRCLAKEPNHRPTARDVVRALEPEGSPAGEGAAEDPLASDLQAVIERRVPQIILLTVGVGITLIGLADALEKYLPEDGMLLTIVFVVAAVVASGVVAWFHGKKGRQRAPTIEYVLLALVALGWVAVSAAVLAR